MLLQHELLCGASQAASTLSIVAVQRKSVQSLSINAVEQPPHAVSVHAAYDGAYIMPARDGRSLLASTNVTDATLAVRCLACCLLQPAC